ncbi:uncharacterized protein LOC128221194 isoform X2 [Mya arenaria]|uniref:uncharacterized protein LOC128221194 isoform X2 n=1 Tax=Mya arenaria TaxID=6604 RepID=UPI0022E66000|nr:uncharacterized protein LOC128221194 isoform X2 [Mya arenaria]
MAPCWHFINLAFIYLFYLLHVVKGLEARKPTLSATALAADHTITLTCNIYGETSRSVGWYRNQGPKTISIGYVNNRCETSPPELPFSAKCLCLNITVFSCMLTVEPVNYKDEWRCSVADKGLALYSTGTKIKGSNNSRTEKDSPSAALWSERRSDDVNQPVNNQETTLRTETEAFDNMAGDTDRVDTGDTDSVDTGDTDSVDTGDTDSVDTGDTDSVSTGDTDIASFNHSSNVSLHYSSNGTEHSTHEDPAKYSIDGSYMTIIIASSCGGALLLATVGLLICCLKRRKRTTGNQAENAWIANGDRSRQHTNILQRVYSNNTEALCPNAERPWLGYGKRDTKNANATEDPLYLHATHEPAIAQKDLCYFHPTHQPAKAEGDLCFIHPTHQPANAQNDLCYFHPTHQPANAQEDPCYIHPTHQPAEAQKDLCYIHPIHQPANEPLKDDQNVYSTIGNTTSLDRRNLDRFRSPDEMLKPKRAIVPSEGEYAVPDTELCTIDIGNHQRTRNWMSAPELMSQCILS